MSWFLSTSTRYEIIRVISDIESCQNVIANVTNEWMFWKMQGSLVGPFHFSYKNVIFELPIKRYLFHFFLRNSNSDKCQVLKIFGNDIWACLVCRICTHSEKKGQKRQWIMKLFQNPKKNYELLWIEAFIYLHYRYSVFCSFSLRNNISFPFLFARSRNFQTNIHLANVKTWHLSFWTVLQSKQ